MHVEVAPEILRWACNRVNLDIQIVSQKLPQLPAWERGEKKPTLKQIERFAKIVHAPVGFMFLPVPPEEHLPIPDFRTVGNAHLRHPSPDLLETIYLCQQRQEWYRNFSVSMHDDPLPFVGSVSLRDSVPRIAQQIRNTLGFEIENRSKFATWEEALRQFIAQSDEAGIMVMVSGVVGSNTHRKLNFEEFRGFTLSDDRAPLIFINGKDTKSAQIFTLAHELAHIWLGKTGLSDVGPLTKPTNEIEKWCNQIAAEILVPLASIEKQYRINEFASNEMARLARFYKVSTLVVLRRMFDAEFITYNEFSDLYNAELEWLLNIKKGPGGDYYRSQPARVSRRFARALIVSTLEGQTLHRDAFQLLGVKKLATFRELGNRLGIM